ncbi:hypothetical protein JX266_006394 [Neoarthrinium moseri]|uniref:uncharacterized protein n=1 Tax=Neoarthrinium moseri TaxID=1658444 RepID=UPI001FDC69A0|nr:uncharacterized protein JN550_007101 [Neoarthrinium moseri]KAI1847542.1 hypothetical protein JX266_006394 [Neoarthrinium moseri]KAI1867370.1 hypothetical protein JN550_007101 [Neoarthrinium moseri]
MKAMADTQTSDGLIPDIGPENTVFTYGYRDDSDWGNAVSTLAWQLYETYGDLKLLRDNYSMMQSYVAYLSNKTTTYIINNSGLGDWITFGNRTPKNYTATFGYDQAVDAMVNVAAILGKHEDALYYTTLRTNISNAWNANFFYASNSSYGPTQADNALAIQMKLVRPSVHVAVAGNILRDIAANGDHLTVGEIALPALFVALQSVDRNDLIHRIVTNPTSPSYAYQVLNGATSLNERWNGQTAGASLNHFMLGYVDKWIMEISGMKQSKGSIAWASVDFSPVFVGNLTYAASRYRSARGLIAAHWRLSDSQMAYNITVPVGSVGIVSIKGYENVSEGGVDMSGKICRKGFSMCAAMVLITPSPLGPGHTYSTHAEGKCTIIRS